MPEFREIEGEPLGGVLGVVSEGLDRWDCFLVEE